ncbi:MAG TPA: alanine racemase [Chthoniobacteraceae bacterium]|nr:alanine racemase [Chthoniobacteraceae bacterium]
MDARTKHLRCWAEIDLAAIRHNAALAAQLAGPGVGIMAIVKANGYGHGVAEVVQALCGHVAMFGVANVREAEAVHAALGAGDAPGIFILGPALPEERPEIVAGGFVPAVSSLKEAAAYSALGMGRTVPVHLVIDTGMGRIGIAERDARAAVAEIVRMPDLAITGVATHLPVADEDEAYTQDQLARFQGVLASLREVGVDAPLIHALNSAGVYRFPHHAGTIVRAGLMLYGSSPLPGLQAQLRPALTLKTRITMVRDVPEGHGVSYGRTFITPRPMRIATLAIGYADGYQRRLSGQNTDVLIHGLRCPLLGRVTMDQIMVDVSRAGEAAAGDEAILIGAAGSDEIPAGELAAKAGTIAWEIFTGIGPRVDRIYLNA